jgi:arylsulfatase A-like enzyme
VPARARREHFVLNIDWGPTFAELAGVTAPSSVDGRSIVGLLGRDAPAVEAWRQDFLVEVHRPTGEVVLALRTRTHTYAEHSTGARELYDLRSDPAQLRNAVDAAAAATLTTLSERLKQLFTCAGAACRQ